MPAVDRIWRSRIDIPGSQIGTGGVTNEWISLTAACFTTNASAMIDSDHPDNAQTDGGDLIFATDELGLNRLACHVVRFNLNANPALSEILVNVGQIPSLVTSGTNNIWVLWGHPSNQSQPAAGASFGQHAVYRSAYQVVYGMDLGSGTTLHDYTSNGRNGTLNGGTGWTGVTTAKIGDSLSFDGSNDNVGMGSVTIANIQSGGGAKTIGMWAYVTGSAPATGTVYDGAYLWGDSGGYLGLIRANVSGGGDNIYAYNWDGSEDKVSSATVTSAWRHYVMKHDATTLSLQVNGGSFTGTASGATANTGGTLSLGKAYGAPYYSQGLDSFWILNEAASQAVGTTRYNNENAPGTFAVAQTPERVPKGPPFFFKRRTVIWRGGF